jgi:uncharacterized membrane protein HdeD (DUF308 family)
MHPSQRLLYRRVAVVSGLLGVVALILGIVFYADKHTARGLAAVIVGVILLIVGGAAAGVERRDRHRRAARGPFRDPRSFR